MHIVFVSPEVVPFSKTGGLADMTGALSRALKKSGNEVRFFSPLYKSVFEKNSCKDAGIRVDVPIAGGVVTGEVWKNGDYFFIREDNFFFRDEFYGEGSDDYSDNAIRFAFFSLAVLEALRKMGKVVDLIHCHDWQSALVPVYMKLRYAEDHIFKKAAKVFTIHNLAYQGLFKKETMEQVGLPLSLYNHKQLEFYGQLSFIKGGILFSDFLTTVSDKYSKEIQKSEMGCGLEGLLTEKKRSLSGIINGIDYDEWNPATDRHIVSNYDSDDLSGKKKCKKELKKIFGLPDLGDLPLIGMVSRFDKQKGFELIEGAKKNLAELPAQMVFLGKGDAKIQDFMSRLASSYPEKIGVIIGYDEVLAHKVEAGSDIFLMPSRYEPGGLNQLYSLRYGTIPVVRATGGLDDTISNYDEKKGSGNGFKFKLFSARAMTGALKRAVRLYSEDKSRWRALQKSAMAENYSWGRSALEYEKLYEKTIGIKKILMQEKVKKVQK